MMKKIVATTCVGLTLSLAIEAKEWQYPETEQRPFEEQFHGKTINDPYNWLENTADPAVKAWDKAQNAFAANYLEALPEVKALQDRLNVLSRYDDIKYSYLLVGDRRFINTKKAEEDRWVLSYQDGSGPIVELLNPNNWPAAETLEFASASRDGAYLAFAKAYGGNEKPVIQIMEVATKRILPDTLTGSKQGWPCYTVSWLPNNEGFYFCANPSEDDSRESEYWNSVYFHKLGTQASEDKLIFSDAKSKELFHSAAVSEDGKWLILSKSNMGYVSEVYLQSLTEPDAPLLPLATGFDALYSPLIIGNDIYIFTNRNAPNYKVYKTDFQHLEKEHWQEFIPEQKDRLVDFDAIGGYLYANYLHNASTQIKVLNLDGKVLQTIDLPSLGSASMRGYWSRPETRLSFSSFTVPSENFRYFPEQNKLQFENAPKIAFDPDLYTTSQVWYNSKDGTRVSMFLLLPKNRKDEAIPMLLTGYGGFDHPITPYFSTTFIAFLETGGGIAIPNLRGGGEYGKEWHLKGCKENKQNVFDDFIAAAEYLIANGYTTSGQLGIKGGSNGGLLVGAALVQRPDLFKAVLCEVPLLDMLRYHRFGFANIWVAEYGSAEDPDQFCYLQKYSPYHNIKEDTNYPATLITAGENDVRVDPLHARKMVAMLQKVDPQGEPHLLLIEGESGHGGGTTLSKKIRQTAMHFGFLMSEINKKK